MMRSPSVREAGVEPASLAAADFKSAVYAIPPLAPRKFSGSRARRNAESVLTYSTPGFLRPAQ